MNIEKFEKYEKELNTGLKKQAKKSLQQFIESFKNEDEIERWVWEYLPTLEENRKCSFIRIRHEIFVNLVYPTLKKGFEKGHYDSILWLGKLTANRYQIRYQVKGNFKELDFLGEMSLYHKCYKIDPSRIEGKELLLNCILDWLSDCGHEWPLAILYGCGNGATLEQCVQIREHAELALSLNPNEEQKTFIARFLEKLEQYEKRLKK